MLRTHSYIARLFFPTGSLLLSVAKKLNTQNAGPTRLLPGLAGTDLIFRWIGIVEYIPCYSGPAEHWGLLPATGLACRKILIGQNIKKLTWPALWLLCGPQTVVVYSLLYSAYTAPCTFKRRPPRQDSPRSLTIHIVYRLIFLPGRFAVFFLQRFDC